MKRLRFLVLGLTVVSLIGCGEDSQANIVRDLQAQEQPNDVYHKVQSNTDQNKIKIQTNSVKASYADNVGYYLRNTITHLENLAPFFEDEALNSDELVTAKQTASQLKERSANLFQKERPAEFEGFHDILQSMLIEVNALERVLTDMRNPAHPLQIQNARVYYENIVITHKQLEMEYQTLAEELGIY